MLGAVIAAWERRIFFLDLEVFFFGTAILLSPYYQTNDFVYYIIY